MIKLECKHHKTCPYFDEGELLCSFFAGKIKDDKFAYCYEKQEKMIKLECGCNIEWDEKEQTITLCPKHQHTSKTIWKLKHLLEKKSK